MRRAWVSLMETLLARGRGMTLTVAAALFLEAEPGVAPRLFAAPGLTCARTHVCALLAALQATRPTPSRHTPRPPALTSTHPAPQAPHTSNNCTSAECTGSPSGGGGATSLHTLPGAAAALFQ